MHYIIDMNIPGFSVPKTISVRQPSQEETNKYRKDLEDWKSSKGEEDKKPTAPVAVTATNSEVCSALLKTALQMAVPEGSPDVLRRLQKIHKSIEKGIENKGQMILSVEDYRFLQSKYAKADKWNTQDDVCKTVIAVQDVISRAVMVDDNKK